MSDLIFPRSRPLVTSVHARIGAVVGEAGDYNASQITFAPSGFVTDTDTQAALATIIASITALANPGADYKSSVRVATTSNITLSGTQTIDGIAVIAGDRVLVKNQSTGSENGIYVCAAGAWSRATDADGGTEISAGLVVVSTEGTANADKLWELTTNDPITLGTTALTFVLFNGTVTSVFGRIGAVTATAGDYNAGQITFTPSGTIAATDVGAAIAELDSELPERIDDRVAALLVQGSNITLTYNDVANTLTISAAGVTSEQIDDRVAALLVQGSNITLTYNDGANTLTIDAAGGLTMEQIEDNLAAGVLVSGYSTLIEYDDSANTFTWHEAERICLDADGATITFDLSDDHTDANAGAYHPTEPITQDCTLAVVNAGIGVNNAPGKRFQIRLNYDDVGGHAITFFARINWVNGYPPATTPIGGSGDTFEFLVTAIDEYGVPSFDGWILSTERPVLIESTAAASGPADLDAYWKFDEVSGTRADETATYPLTETGGVTGSGTGKVGNAAQFTSGRSLDNLNNVLNQPNRDFSVWLWVKLTATGFSNFVTGIISGTDSWLITQGRGGANRFSFVVTNNAVTQFAVNSDTFGNSPTGTWCFVVATFDSVTKELSIRVNAGAADTATLTGTPLSGSGGTSGLFVYGLTNNLIDEMGIVPHVLTADEIAYLYNSGTGRTTPFDDVFTDVIDHSVCEGQQITLPPGSGTYTISHVNPIPLKELLVPITSDNASGTIAWAGVTVDWGAAGPPDLPADGDTIYVKFQCVSTSLILGRLWHA